MVLGVCTCSRAHAAELGPWLLFSSAVLFVGGGRLQNCVHGCWKTRLSYSSSVVGSLFCWVTAAAVIYILRTRMGAFITLSVCMSSRGSHLEAKCLGQPGGLHVQDSWVSGLARRYLEVKSLDLARGSHLEARCLGHPGGLHFQNSWASAFAPGYLEIGSQTSTKQVVASGRTPQLQRGNRFSSTAPLLITGALSRTTNH